MNYFKQLLDFRKNMAILAVCSFLGMIFTYYTNGRSMESNSFQVASSLTITFSVFLIISHFAIIYIEKKKKEKIEAKRNELSKEKSNHPHKKNKKKSKKKK